MNTSAFIARQHAKYYLKVLKQRDKDEPVDVSVASRDDFWQYEQTPRVISA